MIVIMLMIMIMITVMIIVIIIRKMTIMLTTELVGPLGADHFVSS